MSLSLRDELRALLAPGRLTLLRLKAGLRPRIADKVAIDCTPAADEAPWQAALSALQNALKEARWQRADLTVLLSNHLVRYRLLPGADKLGGEDELQALARYSFEKAYGVQAKNWDVRVSPDATALASGIDASLLDGLRKAAKDAGVQLVSVQPLLMFAFNAWRSELRGAPLFYAVAEPGRVCMALLRGDAWESITSVRADDPAQALTEVLERQKSLSGMDAAADLWLHAPDYPQLSPAGDWKVHRLTPPAMAGFSPIADGRFALAVGR